MVGDPTVDDTAHVIDEHTHRTSQAQKDGMAVAAGMSIDFVMSWRLAELRV